MIAIIQVSEDHEFDQVFRIRKEVFVVEQAVPEDEEWDEFEHICKHYLAYWGDIPVGTARWRRTLSGDYKLERFAVLLPYRGRGVGEAILEAVLKDVPRQENSKIYLHAQISAKGFYEKNGFVPEGKEFDEAGIRHMKMIYKK